jgi:hypothetical protein
MGRLMDSRTIASGLLSSNKTANQRTRTIKSLRMEFQKKCSKMLSGKPFQMKHAPLVNQGVNINPCLGGDNFLIHLHDDGDRYGADRFLIVKTAF